MNKQLRTLIVDDDQRMAKTLQDILTAKGYHAVISCSAPEALTKLTEQQFNCVITDIKMPEMNGVELLRAIKQKQPKIPVVLMTAYSSDRLINEALLAGAIAAIPKPLDIESLLNFFSMLRKERSLVIVDDDPDFCKTLGDILQQRDFAVTQITDPYRAADKIKADMQVVLLDMKLNHINGLDIFREIKRNHPQLPVILVTGYREEVGPMVDEALKIGAYTCLYKPFHIEKLFTVLHQAHQALLAGVLIPSDRKRSL